MLMRSAGKMEEFVQKSHMNSSVTLKTEERLGGAWPTMCPQNYLPPRNQ
jgi:hypothetical protein